MAERRPQQTAALVELLSGSGLDFVVIGGVAAIMHGSARMTLDLDISMAFTRENLERLLEVLRPHNPRHATRPDLSILDEPIERLLGFRMLLIETGLGRLDVLPGVEPFGHADLPTEVREVFGRPCRVLALDALIEVKRLAGRRKDIEAVYELEAIRDRLRGDPRES
jgi:hypothetical protein